MKKKIGMTRRTCLFCGAPGTADLSDEHIVPRWLLDHLNLPDDDQLLQAVADSTTGQLSAAPRVHSTFRFVEGRVCVNCNTGWMSRLESAAKPLLVPLIDNQRTVTEVTKAESAILKKWAIKTSYLHSYASPLKKPVPLDHLQHLLGDSGQPATGVSVFVTQAPHVKPSGYFQTGMWPQLAGRITDQDGLTPSGAYKIGLQFRSLYLLVAYWPTIKSSMVRVSGLHHRLGEDSDTRDLEYELNVQIGQGPVARLAAFASTLAVLHTTDAV